jgi:hypothetical protein
VGRDNSVGIGTRNRLDGPGIESRWRGDIFRTFADRPWGGSFPGVQRSWPPHLAPRLKKKYSRTHHLCLLDIFTFLTHKCINPTDSIWDTGVHLDSKLLLDAFAKFREATISFVMSACLSVCPSTRPHEITQLSLDGF